MFAVPEKQLHPEHHICPVCGDNDFSNAKVILQLQKEPDVYLKQCLNCFAASASRMPTDEYLEKLYTPETYQSALTHDDVLVTKCAENIQAFFKVENRRAIEILDYGGGNGNLALKLMRNLYQQHGDAIKISVSVVDIFPREDKPDLKFITVETFLESEKKYDIVITSAVLEHIPSLQLVLEKLFRVGKEGALFYSRTPYEVPLAKYIPGYQIKWPRHVHDLGPQFWHRLTSRMNIELLESRTSIVESSLKHKPLQALMAYLLKFPSILETRLIGKPHKRKTLLWHFVGGWEVFIKLADK